MFEPKVQGSKTGGKVKRYFVPETMAFFKRYVDDFHIVGQWFKRFSSEENNYQSYNTDITLAGLRAGIWRFKYAEKGQALTEGEKVAPDGRVYRLKSVNNSKNGTQEFHKQWLTEGKLTTTHTTMKHTFVSLAGLHGFSLDNCAEQCGTDPTTIRDFYHGTLGVGLQKVVMGEKIFVPWREWIQNFVEPLYTKRYNELMNKGKSAVNMQAITQAEIAIAGIEG
jgi:hypothetical protein